MRLTASVKVQEDEFQGSDKEINLHRDTLFTLDRQVEVI